MGEVLTISEIRVRYDGEWVMVGDFEENGRGEELRAVLAHSPDRDEAYRQLAQLPCPRHFTSLCLVRTPKDMHFWISVLPIGEG